MRKQAGRSLAVLMAAATTTLVLPAAAEGDISRVRVAGPPVAYELTRGAAADVITVEAAAATFPRPSSNTAYRIVETITTDTTAPETSISSGPPGLTNATSVSFTFASTEPGSFECRLDGPGPATGNWEACSSPKTYSGLTDGSHTFSVFATDTAGNPDITPEGRAFTVDTVAPQTTLDGAFGPAGSSPTLYHLAERTTADNAIENAYIVRRNGWYYLFASFDYCCRSLDSSYNIRVGRSTSPNGPYVDAAGRSMLMGGGTTVLSSHDDVVGPGGQSIVRDEARGEDLLVYHYYDGSMQGRNRLGINLLRWDLAGWPVVL